MVYPGVPNPPPEIIRIRGDGNYTWDQQLGHWHNEGRTLVLTPSNGHRETRLFYDEENGGLFDGYTDGLSLHKVSGSPPKKPE